VEKVISESPYIYVSNNPLLFFDPDGRYKVEGNNSSKVLSNYLKNNISEILNSKSIMQGLQKYGQLSKEQIENIVSPNNGLVIELLDYDLSGDAAGYYSGGMDGKIQISKSIIDELNNANGEDIQAALLNVVSTILHETVHYGDWQDGATDDNKEATYNEVEEDGETYQVYKLVGDKGHMFENDVYFNSDDENTINNSGDAKKVIEEKSKTEEGRKVLPTVPQF